MAMITYKGIEFYIPESSDLAESMDTAQMGNQHTLDCGCPTCNVAKDSRMGCYHNGIEWVEIL